MWLIPDFSTLFYENLDDERCMVRRPKTAEAKKPSSARKKPDAPPAFNPRARPSAEAAVAAINARHGVGTVRKFTERVNKQLAAYPSGCPLLDIEIGCGGYPAGHVVEAFGPPEGGKTTLLWHLIAETQRRGGAAALVEVEHKIDPAYAARIGVDLDALFLAQPDSAEEVCGLIEELAASGAFDIIGLDSIGQLNMASEIGGDGDKDKTGEDSVASYKAKDYGKASNAGFARAKLLRDWMRNMIRVCGKSQTTLFLINHTYDSPDKGEQTAGGGGPKYAASVRMKVQPWWSQLSTGKRARTGVKVTVVKNQVGGAPYARVELAFAEEPHSGLDRHVGLLHAAVAVGVIDKKGAWYSWSPDGEPEKLGQGWVNAARTLANTPELAAQVEAAVDASCGWVRP